MTPQYWKNKRVLLTGHTGFKGSWLLRMLRLSEARVSGYALAPATQPNMYSLLNLHKELEHEWIADIRDRSSLREAFQKSQAEVVFHLAAQPLVLDSYESPLETFEVNALGTANVLQAVRTAETVRSVVIVTTDKCYENQERSRPYSEDEKLGGHDPYSASKACAEIITHAMRASFLKENGVAVASARAGNVIGGGDWSRNRLLPDVIRSLAENNKVRIRNPQSVRPWQHVLEPLSGYLSLAEHLYQPEMQGAFNFGPQELSAVTVEQLVHLFRKAWKNPFEIEVDSQFSGPHEARTLKLDSSKAETLLKWKPRLSLETGVQWTAEWYQQAMENPGQLKTLTDQQIQKYAQLGEST